MAQRRFYSVWMSAALLFTLVRCRADHLPTAPGIVAVSLTPPAATVRVGSVVQLTPTVTVDGRATTRTVRFTSSDPSVVNITADGTFRALRVGTASVTAATESISATALVTVIAGAPAFIVKTAGDSQVTTAGGVVAIPPAVTVSDSAANPVSGVIVTFSGTGIVTGASATTNQDGVASVASWTLARGTTANVLTASVTDIGYVSFSATGTAPTIDLGRSDLQVTQPVGSGTAITQVVPVANAGSGTLWGLAVGAITFTGAPGWLTASLDGTIAPANVHLAANPTGLSVGTYTATVPILGANALNRVQELVFTLTIDAAATSTVLASSANPSVLGQDIVLTATVSAAGLVPNGSVQFKDGGVSIGAPVKVTANGTATLATTALSLTASPHTLTAEYTGDVNGRPSVSSALTQVVGTAAASVSLTSNASTVTYGTSVTFTATVTGPGGTPTGLVEFRDGETVLGSISLSGGVATFSALLRPRAYAISAVYKGDASHTASSSPSLSQDVKQGAAAVTLATNANPSVVGAALTFTASVGGTLGIATGTVTFMDGAATLGSATLVDGSASFAGNSLAAGSAPHLITVTYGGDATYAVSASAVLSQVVAEAATSITVTSSLANATPGTPVTFVATIRGPGATPTGTVTFKDGTLVLGAAAVVGGSASFTTTTLSATGSTHDITAVYSGDANNLPSGSAPLSQVVSTAATSVRLTSNASTVTYGTSVTFTATVTGPGGTPTGLVEFRDGETVLGSISLSGGVATFSALLRPRAYAISAVYKGDASHTASSSPSLSQDVKQGAAAVTLATNANPSVVGAALTFTASVSGILGIATGTVTFMDGAATLGSATLVDGSASFAGNSLAAGSAPHLVTVTYGGDATYAASTSAVLSQVVAEAATSITVTSSLANATPGTPVTFVATIRGPGATPTGTVTFKDGTLVLGAAAVVGGSASFTTTTLSATGSTHDITAVYSGDANNLPSGSATLSQAIVLTATSTTISSSANPALPSQSVTFIASVSSTSGALSGTVQFMDSGIALAAPQALNGAGQAILTTSALSADGSPHLIAASYSGDVAHVASASISLEQKVERAVTTVTLSASSAASNVGDNVTFTARAGSTAGVPTGTVQFRDADVMLASVEAGADGVAVLAISSLAPGTHTITAAFASTASYLASASLPLSLVVSKSIPTNTVSATATGQTTTILARVTGALTTPTGTVKFKDGNTALSGAVTLTDGVATFATFVPSFVGARHSFVAEYSGDGTYVTLASAPFAYTVSTVAVTLDLTAGTNPSAAGSVVTFAATVVVDAGRPQPVGTVQFRVDGVNLGAPVAVVAGRAIFSTSALTVSHTPHSIIAAYSGDINFQSAVSRSVTQTITP